MCGCSGTAWPGNVAVALLAWLAVALVFTLAALALDAGEVRSLLARLTARLPGRRKAAR